MYMLNILWKFGHAHYIFKVLFPAVQLMRGSLNTLITTNAGVLFSQQNVPSSVAKDLW